MPLSRHVPARSPLRPRRRAPRRVVADPARIAAGQASPARRTLFGMNRRRWLAKLALGLLVLVAELTGRSLTHRINLGPGRVSYVDAAYYPFVVAAVEVRIALIVARPAGRVFPAPRPADPLR